MKWFRNMVVNFFVRMMIGVVVIFLVNQFLMTEEIELSVGVNPATAVTAGILGVPGVCLLYGILLFD